MKSCSSLNLASTDAFHGFTSGDRDDGLRGELSASTCRRTGGSANSRALFLASRPSAAAHTCNRSVMCYCRTSCLDVIFFIILSRQEALSDRYRSGCTFIPVGVMCHLDAVQQWEYKQHEKMERRSKNTNRDWVNTAFQKNAEVQQSHFTT